MRRGHWELTGWRVPFLELRWTLNRNHGSVLGPYPPSQLSPALISENCPEAFQETRVEGREGHEEGWASGRYPVTLLLIRAVPE